MINNETIIWTSAPSIHYTRNSSSSLYEQHTNTRSCTPLLRFQAHTNLTELKFHYWNIFILVNIRKLKSSSFTCKIHGLWNFPIHVHVVPELCNTNINSERGHKWARYAELSLARLGINSQLCPVLANSSPSSSLWLEPCPPDQCRHCKPGTSSHPSSQWAQWHLLPTYQQ